MLPVCGNVKKKCLSDPLNSRTDLQRAVCVPVTVNLPARPRRRAHRRARPLQSRRSQWRSWRGACAPCDGRSDVRAWMRWPHEGGLCGSHGILWRGLRGAQPVNTATALQHPRATIYATEKASVGHLQTLRLSLSHYRSFARPGTAYRRWPGRRFGQASRSAPASGNRLKECWNSFLGACATARTQILLAMTPAFATHSNNRGTLCNPLATIGILEHGAAVIADNMYSLAKTHHSLL